MSYEKDLNIVLGAINMATSFNMSQSEEEKLVGRIKDVYAKAEAFDEVSKISRHVFIKDKDKLKMIDKVVESEADE